MNARIRKAERMRVAITIEHFSGKKKTFAKSRYCESYLKFDDDNHIFFRTL